MSKAKCLHCGNQLEISNWDSWNGFLVKCPSCGGLHGMHWNLKRLMLASLFFNAFSFLFTMRLPAALLSLAAFLVVGISVNYFLDRFPDIWQVAGVGIFMLAPLIVNAAILLKRESAIANSAPTRQTFRR